MVGKGLNTPNTPFDNFPKAVIDALYDLRPRSLLYLMYDVTTERRFNRVTVIGDYCHAYPDTNVIVRCCADNIITFNPKDWAHECRDRLDYISPLLPDFPEVCGANEFNVDSPVQYREDWQYQISWLTSWQGVWNELGVPYRTHLPALSPSGAYHGGWNAYAASDLFGLFDVADLHIYDENDLSDLDNMPSVIGQPKAITEWNRILPATFLDEVGNRATSANYFILGGSPEWAQYDILKPPAYPTYYTSFKNWTGGTQPVAAETAFDRYARDLFKRRNVPYNAESAIVKYWAANQKTTNGVGAIGAPDEQEHPDESGKYVYANFGGTIVKYEVATGETTEGYPPGFFA